MQSRDSFGNVFYTHATDFKKIIEDGPHACMKISETNSELLAPAIAAGFKFWFVDCDRNIILGSDINKMVPIATHSPGINVLLLRDNNGTTECLLVEEINRRGKLKNITGCMEAELTSLEVVKKEIFEESGYSVDTVNPLFWQERPMLGRIKTSDIIFYYTAFTSSQDEPKIPADEISSACWMSLADAMSNNIVSNTTKKTINHYMSTKKLPQAVVENDWIPTGKQVLTCLL